MKVAFELDYKGKNATKALLFVEMPARINVGDRIHSLDIFNSYNNLVFIKNDEIVIIKDDKVEVQILKEYLQGFCEVYCTFWQKDQLNKFYQQVYIHAID